MRAEAVGTPALRWDDLPDFVPVPGDPRRPPRTVIGSAGLDEAEVWWRPRAGSGHGGRRSGHNRGR